MNALLILLCFAGCALFLPFSFQTNLTSVRKPRRGQKKATRKKGGAPPPKKARRPKRGNLVKNEKKAYSPTRHPTLYSSAMTLIGDIIGQVFLDGASKESKRHAKPMKPEPVFYKNPNATAPPMPSREEKADAPIYAAPPMSYGVHVNRAQPPTMAPGADPKIWAWFHSVKQYAFLLDLSFRKHRNSSAFQNTSRLLAAPRVATGLVSWTVGSLPLEHDSIGAISIRQGEAGRDHL